jgi:hypothetical protein
MRSDFRSEGAGSQKPCMPDCTPVLTKRRFADETSSHLRSVTRNIELTIMNKSLNSHSHIEEQTLCFLIGVYRTIRGLDDYKTCNSLTYQIKQGNKSKPPHRHNKPPFESSAWVCFLAVSLSKVVVSAVSRSARAFSSASACRAARKNLQLQRKIRRHY